MLFLRKIVFLILFSSLLFLFLLCENVSAVVFIGVQFTNVQTENLILKEGVVINEIQVVGNKVTRKHIILREISFHAGDTIGKAEMEEKLKTSRQNLLNTSLFNFVTVDTVSSGNNQVNILVTVAERWYTWPVPVFEVQERNFNEWWKTKNFERANYGFYLNRENFRGRKEDLSFYAQFGYTEKYGISYKIPYLTKKQVNGAGFSFSYSRNHEVPFASVNNHQVYFKNPDEYVRQELIGKLHTTYRRGVHNSHYFELKFTNALVHDTIRSLTVDYFAGNDIEMKYFGLDYFFRCDYRDSRYYPLRGYFLELEVNKFGLGILKKEKLDVTHFSLAIRGYEKLSSRFYLLGALKGKFSANINEPYYVQKGLGWRDYVRGYEYYVIDGQRYGTTKVGLKYEIIKPHVQTIPLPLNKFNTFHYALYAGVYGDAGYVEDRLYAGQNSLANALLYGYGVGIDYVTYYDIVLRFEYSFNRRFEHGFFLHFDAGI